jgi:SPP1 gp7 family putative phage head morphogenesis protein
VANPINIRAALDLRPEDAIRAFRQRDELGVSYGWRDWAPEEHARAFTIANVFKLDLLVEAGGSLDAALKEGKTEQMWREGLSAELQAFGKRRLQTIFRTNMRVSRAAGQWARIQSLKAARPFLRYSAILDRRTRPLHARWHGIIRPVDDPIWQTIYPPNGWNCRCQVQQLSQRDMDRRGYVVTPDTDLPQLEVVGETLMGGRIRSVFKGVDEGWDYNPGAASFAGLVARAAEVLAKAEAAGLDLAAAEVREAILAELEKVLGRTVAQQLLAGTAAQGVAPAYGADVASWLATTRTEQRVAWLDEVGRLDGPDVEFARRGVIEAGLPLDAGIAARMYSGIGTVDDETRVFEAFNRAFRQGDPPEKWRRFGALVEQAMERLPTPQQAGVTVVYAGKPPIKAILDRAAAALETGRPFDFQQFQSTSSDIARSLIYTDRSGVPPGLEALPNAEGIMFRIIGPTRPRSLAPIAMNPDEAEFLYPARQRFRVLTIEQENDYVRIDIEELD